MSSRSCAVDGIPLKVLPKSLVMDTGMFKHTRRGVSSWRWCRAMEDIQNSIRGNSSNLVESYSWSCIQNLHGIEKISFVHRDGWFLGGVAPSDKPRVVVSSPSVLYERSLLSILTDRAIMFLIDRLTSFIPALDISMVHSWAALCTTVHPNQIVTYKLSWSLDHKCEPENRVPSQLAQVLFGFGGRGMSPDVLPCCAFAPLGRATRFEYWDISKYETIGGEYDH